MTDNISVEEKNKVIAEFDGRYRTMVNGEWWWSDREGLDPFQWQPCDLKYHASWGWLKPVIDKIFEYSLAHPDQVKKVTGMSVVVKIEAAHEAVYDFISWYNTQHKK